MRYLQLRLRFPPEARHPMHRYLTESDALRRSYMRHWNFSDPERVTAMFVVTGDVDAAYDDYVAALEDVETIRDFDATRVDDERLYVYVDEHARGHARRFRELLDGTGLLVVPPLQYTADGELLFEVGGEDEELRALVAGLPDGLTVSIDRLGEYEAYQDPSAALTARQREAVATARRLGYYDVPRTAGVREVADALGCSKSTAADHLRKAEARLVTEFLGSGREARG